MAKVWGSKALLVRDWVRLDKLLSAIPLVSRA